MAQKLAPDVVVLDIGLPDMDGYTLAQELRKLNATEAAILIALTGYGSELDRTHSAETGIDHQLVKPVDSARIRGIIEAV